MAVDKFAVESTTITAKISAHYVDNARNLPWRVPPLRSAAGERPDPYHVWLSEVMLQQTTVAAVKSYFEAFTMRWPKVQDLAQANEADVLAAWAGLGYYARARNLHKCARFVVEELDGSFPQNEAELLKLPGVGAYTAAAIAAIAFGERAVVVDANIERLVARLFAIDTPLPSGKLEIKQAMDKLTPQSGAGDFAQACMDIGASICTAKNPKCMLCPVQLECRALVEGDVERFPIKPPKKSKPVRKARFFWIERDGKLLLKPRPEKGMLAGMRALPSDDWAAKRDGHAKLPIEGKWTIRENIVQHSFTHFSLEVDMAVLEDDKIPINIGDNIWNDSIWWPLETITDAGLPTLFAKAVKWKLEELE
ncbi:A/G-specific adenine glycosylase [Parasphingorhabdus halotolerans]|uniref:Adenine DNA glycosylase n=1 Tax=Parasphingorhabdus halotolerans TaxID=2725558 RepID=A0A6H2DM18_9SPHN|nr:A/G-specific adenine glycosylase [Parasphingorhabdus halotolerans]QJB69177.1 A/G-specific adenine glycosylase [Parasphingorhabdus halotolerans]